MGSGSLFVDRCFILMRKDEREDVPVAVYTFDQREACKLDRDHRQSVNPDAYYYVWDKPLNPKLAE